MDCLLGSDYPFVKSSKQTIRMALAMVPNGCERVRSLMESEPVHIDSNDTKYLYSTYRQTLSDLLDKHAPRCTVIRRKRPHAQWFDAECYSAKCDDMKQCTGV